MSTPSRSRISAPPSPAERPSARSPPVAAAPTPQPPQTAAPEHSPTPVSERHPVPSDAGPPSAPGGGGTVRSYLVPGGRVAVNLRPDSAELVSAVPDPGWQLQMWTGDQWLRVDFTQADSTNSVFVTWNGHPPDVQTVVR
ncbi:hypothetical protein [Kitasatospora acidiphila]|uniref:hypothetical protein n=1 Tax=Kitasatospora acidiphila TaxID=2567942 RepID=UPI003C72C78F